MTDVETVVGLEGKKRSKKICQIFAIALGWVLVLFSLYFPILLVIDGVQVNIWKSYFLRQEKLQYYCVLVRLTYLLNISVFYII